jgi:hypothetical protein
MKKTFLLFLLLTALNSLFAQSPVGKWQKTAHMNEYEGEKFDSHVALLQQRPCAAKVYYELNADATFRLRAKESGCDERYIKIQEKLYSQTNWRMQDGKITISTLKDFSVGQTYIIKIVGNTMTWTGTDGQGVITYKRL